MKRIMRALIPIGLLLLALTSFTLSAAKLPPELVAAYRAYAAFKSQGKYTEAEPFARKALELGKDEFGSSNEIYATLLGNLAELHYKQGRASEAERLFKRALAIKEKALGPGHRKVGRPLNNLALLYKSQGRYREAELVYKRALEIARNYLDPDNPDFAILLDNIAALYHAQGHTGKAEPLNKRALEILEKTLGPNHPDVAGSLNNLAGLYRAQGRESEAALLHKRALAILEKALGPNHPDVATSLDNLATVYHRQGHLSEAEPLRKRSLAILEKAFGPDHSSVATSLNNLAGLYDDQGHFREAEPFYARSLAIYENAFGPDHPAVATSLNNLARLYVKQGRYREAERHYVSSLAIRERALRPDHPDVAESLYNLAVLHRTRGKAKQSLDFIRRAVAIISARAIRTGGGEGTGRVSEQRFNRDIFVFHVQDTVAMSRIDTTNRSALYAEGLFAEGFKSVQLANATSVGTAVSRMAARFAAGDDALAGLVRDRQDAAARWRALDGALTTALSRPPKRRDKTVEAEMRHDRDTMGRTIKDIDAELASLFPQFTELSTPKPVPMAETQALLGPHEALLTYLVWNDRSFVFVVRRDGAVAREVDIGTEDLQHAVDVLRKGLDPTGLNKLPTFNTDTAHKLYKKLFQPIQPVLSGARHLFVVPDEALQSLPLAVLATKEFKGTIKGPGDYRQVPWLARTYAITTLPSVSSLKALRVFAKRARASRPFLGIGDPQLEGETGSNRGLKLASLFTVRGVADADAVRQLASLPDSYGELKSLAQSLGASDDALLVGTNATESKLKNMALSDYKVLTFATHGLVAGEMTGLSEPALVMTPPKIGTKSDDGLLTASEVATLKLDADWVILSACNTAAADGTAGAEGLSGLAKAFFYAGARSLLVSHWPVVSDAAVKITTRMLSEAQEPGIGRAEAHRRAALALIDGKEKPEYAHPLFWAPFVVVGEGGSGARH